MGCTCQQPRRLARGQLGRFLASDGTHRPDRLGLGPICCVLCTAGLSGVWRDPTRASDATPAAGLAPNATCGRGQPPGRPTHRSPPPWPASELGRRCKIRRRPRSRSRRALEKPAPRSWPALGAMPRLVPLRAPICDANAATPDAIGRRRAGNQGAESERRARRCSGRPDAGSRTFRVDCPPPRGSTRSRPQGPAPRCDRTAPPGRLGGGLSSTGRASDCGSEG